MLNSLRSKCEYKIKMSMKQISKLNGTNSPNGSQRVIGMADEIRRERFLSGMDGKKPKRKLTNIQKSI